VIAQGGFGLGDGSAGKFNGPASLPKNTTDGKRFDIFNQTHDTVFLVNKNHINRKTHKKHVDLLTARDDESLALRKMGSIQKPDHVWNKTIGHLDVVG